MERVVVAVLVPERLLLARRRAASTRRTATRSTWNGSAMGQLRWGPRLPMVGWLPEAFPHGLRLQASVLSAVIWRALVPRT
jgi:hypothetical protein